MNPERWQLIESLFLAASERDATQRIAFLDEACRGDAELRREVDALIAADDQAEKFIEAPALDFAADLIGQHNIEPEEGRKLGPYQLVRELGEGGMGAVYLATRADDQYQKQVAVKLVKRGLDTDEMRRRFRHERQILANLDHPNIARLIDGGTTEGGRPYLVMDYVEGEPITRYCDEHQISTEERLKLFQLVCLAVGYAHRNLVIHRDIKPSNIIVTEEGTPKLLDFGIAKLLSSEVAQPTERTATVARIMTPQYASPEQVRGSAITTASDIYSLGVLLYKLLTGHHPYQFKTLLPTEIERVICDKEPERPSTAITRVEELTDADGVTTGKITPESVSEARGDQPDGLRRKLKGDLDSIVLMAMRKEPERRYLSVEQFSEDIRRHLEGLPVVATNHTFNYRASKFVGRNKVGVAAAAVVFLAILGGMMASIWQARVARRERAKAEAVSSFLQGMLSASNPTSTLHKKSDLTVRDVLDEASKRLATEDLSSQPEVKAELQRIIGISYDSVGQYDLAESNLTAALEAQTKIYGEDNLETVRTLVIMAEIWALKGDYARADSFYQQKIAILRTEQRKGTISADYLIAALYDFAITRRVQGDSKESEKLLLEALSLSSQASPDQKNNVGVIEGVLALSLADQGKFDDAEKVTRARVASIRQQTSEEVVGPALSTNLTMLGGTLMEKGQLVEAEEALREAEGIYRKLYDHTYMPLGDNLRIQAQVLYAAHKYSEAEAKINETLEIYRKSSGRGYINYPTALIIQGFVYSQNKRTTEAEQTLREAVQIRSEHMPEAHFLRAVANGALGEFLTTQKRFAEAEPLLLNSNASLKTSQAANSPRTRTALLRLVTLYENWARPDAANEYRKIIASL